MQAMVQAARSEQLPVDICAVISNRPQAAGLVWATAQGIPTHIVNHQDYSSRDAFDAQLLAEIDRYQPDYVLLAGFMRVLTSGFVEHYLGRLINIHPSLLPLFPGLHTHQQAIDSGMACHGCTVHFVTPEVDAGPIIAQGVLPIYANDSVSDLAKRLLPLEHRVYTEVFRWLVTRQVRLTAQQQVVLAQDQSRVFFSSAS